MNNITRRITKQYNSSSVAYFVNTPITQNTCSIRNAAYIIGIKHCVMVHGKNKHLYFKVQYVGGDEKEFSKKMAAKRI
jgi:hypothetical protein